MKSLILVFFVFCGSDLFASHQQYQLIDNQLVALSNNVETNDNEVRESIKLRIKIKKFIVTKTPQGISVKYEPVCEFDTNLGVDDLTSGGLVSEKDFGSCASTKDGKSVTVLLSGMVYDSIGTNFTDEVNHLQRNFFTHFYLQSSEIIFGLGDFNLGTTRTFPFKHWVSELSTDSAGGNSLTTQTRREGFISAVRYSIN